MAQSDRIAGTSFLKAGGEGWPVLPGATCTGFVPEREGIAGADGTVHGYKETAGVPTIECEISAQHHFTIVDFDKKVDGKVIMLEAANGHVYVLKRAWLSPDSTDLGEGKHSVKIQGMSGRIIK